MYDELQAFFENPNFENYSAARRAIGDSHGSADPLQMAELEHLRRLGEFHQVKEKIDAMGPCWALNPRIHFHAAWAAEQLGDKEDAELERFQTAACLKGLLDSGDGSQERPYIVCFPEDEYDLMRFLGRTPRSQKLVRRGSVWLDVIDCEDGSQLWFDATELDNGAPHFLRKRRMAEEKRAL